jgi:small subunit ribosomal protein S21
MIVPGAAWRPGGKRATDRDRCHARRPSLRDAADAAARWCPVKVEVVDNQVEQALKALKKRMERDGAFKEMKRRAFYEKPSVRRKRKQALARKRRRRAMQRDRNTDD